MAVKDVVLEETKKAISKAVGDELRRLREAQGLSRAVLVRMLPSKINERTLLSYEHGLRQLTLPRLTELTDALSADPVTVFALALQRARVHLNNLPLHVDLNRLLGESRYTGKFWSIKQWARNTLNEFPDGVVQVEPAAIRHLALFAGCHHYDLVDYLARFVPEDVAVPPVSGGQAEAAPASSGH